MIKILLFIVALTILSTQSFGGEIKGRVADGQGTPLPKVEVCLSHSSNPMSCLKTKMTNHKGNYAFKGIKNPGHYIIQVKEILSVTKHQHDQYSNYVWAPEFVNFELKSKSDSVDNVDFTGSFNFSNFQKVLRLTSVDFPELIQFNLDQDYVFLKLYTIDKSGEQNLIYIGQVITLDSLVFEVSVPLSSTELHYELFSSTDSVSNTIPLSTL